MRETQSALLFVIVERGKAGTIVDAARKAGATGATVFFARGTGTQEHQSIFRIQVDSMKEVIMILAPEPHTCAIADAVTSAGRLYEPGTGILFTIPVGLLVGLEYREKDEDDA